MTAIGVIGLGAMGAAIAGRLLDLGGNEVYGTNRTKAKAEPVISQGLRWHDTPREVASVCDVVISIVADDVALMAVADGPDGILAGLRPGSVYIDMSTVSPQASKELAAQVADAGAVMVDAPVSGSVPAAREGSLTIMVGGPEMGFMAAEPVLRHLGKVTHVGDNGHGLLLKLAVNISLAAQMLAFSEGVLLAERGGIDPSLATKVMTQSAIASPMLQARAPLLLNLPEQAWFDVELMHKDIRLAREVGRQERVPLPSSDAVEAMLVQAEKAGYGHRDIAGLFDVLVKASG
jgi:3-hydroxyisobutyrate dehydrogenase-like beta-hydroxyacid dehydrogenase